MENRDQYVIANGSATMRCKVCLKCGQCLDINDYHYALAIYCPFCGSEYEDEDKDVFVSDWR